MLTLSLPDSLATQLQNAASARDTSTEALAETVLRDFLREEARQIIAREAEAFRAMHADLLTRYPNAFVAIHEGAVVDHDADQVTLWRRVQARYPDVPVLIRQVRPEAEQVITIRSPRIEHA